MIDLKTMLVIWLAAIDPAVLTGLKVAALAILGDTVIGWILAMTRGQLNIRLVPKFLQTNIIPYLGALCVLAGMTVVSPDYKPVFYLICTIVSAKFGVEALKDKLMQFFKPANEPPQVS
jgi:hypothetical protein